MGGSIHNYFLYNGAVPNANLCISVVLNEIWLFIIAHNDIENKTSIILSRHKPYYVVFVA